MPEEEKELTLREELELQLNNQDEEEGEEEDDEQEADDKDAEEASDEDDSSTDEDEDVDNTEEQTADEDTSEDSEDDAEGDEEEEVDNLEAPEHWSSDDRETFNAQPQDAKAFMMKPHNEMESGFTKKSQELAAQRKGVEGLTQFQEKWSPHTDALGIPLMHGVDKLWLTSLPVPRPSIVF